jgi:hypothetical protein
MRRSRCLLSAFGLLLITTACQGDPSGPAPSTPDDATAALNAPADGTLRWSHAVVWSGDLNSCRQGEVAATRECLIKAMQAGGASADAVRAAE